MTRRARGTKIVNSVDEMRCANWDAVRSRGGGGPVADGLRRPPHLGGLSTFFRASPRFEKHVKDVDQGG